ncbi:MAG: hypothetical protein OEM06_16335 [Desulfobacteraceae bacterium]|nr:hypothetical protein [Desulfobacteraceae bacterium]MDH3838391.1 hypothetical protein [Desulfobacteraceae bacterium]MDH3875742.1 hypothetical protein [Desulfobacteraceae bacterium]
MQDSGIKSGNFVAFLQHKLLSAFPLPASQRQWKKTFNSASSATRANLPEADKAGGDIKEYFQQKNKNEIK